METRKEDIEIGLIFPNPDQPRKEFDPEKLEELAMSIKQYGVLQHIVVTPRDGRYMIIAGERRWRASQIAGREDIPATVIEADDALVEELALLENIQRQDLNIVEEAKAFQSLIERGWSKEELAEKMGFKQVWRVDERLSLLNLREEYRRLVVSGDIGNSQAFEMSRVGPERQDHLFSQIKAGKLSTYNKLRSYVDGLLALDRQDMLFALQSISERERQNIVEFEGLVRKVERFVGQVMESGRLKDFRKAAFHSDISTDRLDYVIQSLQKLRKSVFAGEGVKSALQEAA